MAQLRSATDQNLVRLLRARAEGDTAFRESLAREIQAEPKYQEYIQRKRQEGASQWLSEEDWEAYVFGKEPANEAPAEQPVEQAPTQEQSEEQRPSEKADPDAKEEKRSDRLMGRVKQFIKNRRRQRGKKFWEATQTTGSMPKRLFPTRETRHLPKWAAQTSNNPERIMAQAQESQSLMIDWLNRGRGIDKAIGATTVRRDEDPKAEIDLSQKGPVLVIGPPKTKKAMEDKVRERYSPRGVPNWSEGAVDLIRASIAVDRYDDLAGVVDKLKESGIELVSKPRNRFRQATASGYRDVVLNARLPNGHIMELQLHVKPMIKAKDKTHGLYQEIRGLDTKDKDELNEEQQALLDRVAAVQRASFDAAWEMSLEGVEPESIFDAPLFSESKKPKKPKRRKRAGEEEGEETLYFDVDGLPVSWDRPKIPKIHGGGEPRKVQDLAWFMERAVPIAKDEFEILVNARKETPPKGKDDKSEKSEKAARDLHLLAAMRRRAATDPEFRSALQKAMRARKENP